MNKEKLYGWAGKILRVNLTKGEIVEKPLNRKLARMFIGGRGFNSKTLFDEIKPGIDPLSPENVVCLANGPLVGTSLSRTSRIQVSTLSPYSNILGDGNAGGHFPAELKFAGYDQIIISGKAKNPKYLSIIDQNVQIKDASHLWGRLVDETTDILEKDLGKDVKVACIGPAGENLVRFANVMFDRYDAAARGSGAVFGSKNLKAIVARGTSKVELARPDEFKKLVKEDLAFLLKDERIGTIRKYGSHLGISNWEPMFKNGEIILTPEEIPENLRMEGLKKYEKSRKACFNCPVACKEVYEISSGPYSGTKGAGLDYETMYCCGTNTGIFDPEAIYKINTLANKYGLCTVPLGYVIGFAKELYQRKIISKVETEGMPLEWDAETTIELIHKIAKREGIGNLLAEGMLNFARIIGSKAMKYCFHVKGLSRGPIHPNPDKGDFVSLQGLAYSLSTRGSDHLRGGYTFAFGLWGHVKKLLRNGTISKDLPSIVILGQRVCTLADILQTCICAVNSFPMFHPLIFKYPLFVGPAKLLSAATGLNFTSEQLIETTDRIYTLERAFNVRQGITRENDILPLRPEIKETRIGKELLENHEKLLTKYYDYVGWDLKTGFPTQQTFKRLDIEYIGEQLESGKPYPKWEGSPLKTFSKYSK